MEKAIEIAKRGGYKMYISPTGDEGVDILDPLFWVALGKALGWRNAYVLEPTERASDSTYYLTWLNYAIRYFTLKLTGGDEEKFWKELLK